MPPNNPGAYVWREPVIRAGDYAEPSEDTDAAGTSAFDGSGVVSMYEKYDPYKKYDPYERVVSAKPGEAEERQRQFRESVDRTLAAPGNVVRGAAGTVVPDFSGVGEGIQDATRTATLVLYGIAALAVIYVLGTLFDVQVGGGA